MGNLDFYVDFNVEVPDMGEEFNREAEQRLRELAAGHSDLTGSAVSLEKLVKAETSYLYQVRIVVYKRPSDVAAIEKDSESMTALRNALDAIEAQVRDSREKLAQVQPHYSENLDSLAYELSPEEVYATYAKGREPAEILQKSRTDLVTELMVEEGLSQESAYFAADRMLHFAQERADGQAS